MLSPVAKTLLCGLGIILLVFLGVIIVFSVAQYSLPVRDLFGSTAPMP